MNDKVNWLKTGLLVVFFLMSCSTRDELRVATTIQTTNPISNPTKTPQHPNAPTPGPVTQATATAQIVGDFVVNPIVFNTPTAVPGHLNGDMEGEDELLAKISIEALANRAYGQDAGTLTFESILENTGGFNRSLISYPSDGLRIFGFMNVPNGVGPFPVVIFIHGYVNPLLYETLDYSTRYADDLARRGFIVIHPNLRGHPPSDSGADLFDTGKAIDILNLAAIIQRDAGKDGLLSQADPDKIAVWGHSTGGGVAIRVATVNLPSARDTGPAIKAVILYAPMSGDETKNVYKNYYGFSQTRWEYEISFPEEVVQAISPYNSYNRIQAAIQVHHGKIDKLIPIEWSRETCEQMQAVGITVECYEYRTQSHEFCCDSYRWMLDRIVTFLFIHMP